MNHLVFVYGTLRRGHPNQYVLSTTPEHGKATFLGDAKTVEKWPLVIETKFNIPFVLYKPGFGHNIIGEIYQVDDKMLKHLDWFEDCPEWYKRRKLFVTMETDHGPSGAANCPDNSANSLPHDHSTTNDMLDSVDDGAVKKIECWGYVLEDFRDDLAEKEYFADYNVAVQQYAYDKETEEADEDRFEHEKNATLK